MKKRRLNYGGMMFGKAERKALLKAVDKNFWPSGPETKLMEKEAADYLGMKHGVLANSGSSAGLLALSALELAPGSKVAIPATTFPTIFNCILQCGHVPVVVDCDPSTNNIDLDKLEKLDIKDIKAIIAVHAVGNPVDMPRLMKWVLDKNIYVLEDFCDNFGGGIGKKKIGSFGHVGFTSFHAAHIVSMGQGGGVFTNDPTIAKNARMYRDWGRQADLTSRTNNKWPTLPKDYDSRFIYEKIGYNLSPLELQAAMGRIQLKKTDKIKKLRKRNYEFFKKVLGRFAPRLVVIQEDPNIKNPDTCWFSLPLAVTEDERGRLTNYLEENGIETRSLFAGDITAHPAYANSLYEKPMELTGSQWIMYHSFWISSHPRLTQKDREFVVKTFEKYFKLYA